MILLTARLVLRPIQERDAPDIVALDSDPEVMRYLGHPKSTLDLAHTWIELARTYPDGTGYWAAERDGEFIGWFLLRPERAEPHEMELGYRLMQRAWGRGFATEGGTELLRHAWRELDVPTVMATTDANNLRSQSVMRKIEMTHAKDFLYDGRIPSVRYRIARPASAPNQFQA